MNKRERMAQDGHPDIEPIEFFGPKNPYGYFSNFSAHGVVLPNPFTGENFRYQTGEHRFQAMKADDLGDHEWVRTAPTAGEAKKRGRQVNLRDGWGSNYGELCWYVMVETVMAKALQHSTIYRHLLDTGEVPLWEDSPTDDIWGIRYQGDYRGKNLLGRAWMEVRAAIVVSVAHDQGTPDELG